jgi:hypothetical protein
MIIEKDRVIINGHIDNCYYGTAIDLKEISIIDIIKLFMAKIRSYIWK